MAISRVTSQTATGNSAGGIVSATYPATPQRGNLLVAVITYDAGTQSITGFVSATFNNTGPRANVYWKISNGAESVISSSTNATAVAMRISIHEYTGFNGTATLDVSATSSSTGLTIPTGTTPTTTALDVLLIAVGSISANNTLTSWSNSFTTVTTISLATNSHFVAERIVSSTGAYTTTATTTPTSATNVGVIVAFKLLPVNNNNYQFVRVGNGMSSSGRLM